VRDGCPAESWAARHHRYSPFIDGQPVELPASGNSDRAAYIHAMERFTHFGIRGDADEQLRRAVRDGFKRAGLTHAQLTQVMEWYRDHGQNLGGDPTKLTDSFTEFAAAKAWPDAQRDAAVSVYGSIRDQGPTALIAPAPSAEDDAATIARAGDLLRADPSAYWRDLELQEAQYEALERQASDAPGPSLIPSTSPPQPRDRDVDRQRHDEIVTVMRDPVRAGEYWANPTMQQEFRDVLGRMEAEVVNGGPAPAPSETIDIPSVGR
jgi:hypothetical protein